MIDSMMERENSITPHEETTPGAFRDIHEDFFNKIIDCLNNSFQGDDQARVKPCSAFFVAKVIRAGRFSFVSKKLCYDSGMYFIKNPQDLKNDLLTMNFKMNLPITDRDGRPMDFITELNSAFNADYIASEKSELVLGLFKYAEAEMTSEMKKAALREAEVSPL